MWCILNTYLMYLYSKYFTTLVTINKLMQNLVEIAAVSSIIRKLEYFARLAWKRLFSLRNGGFGAFNLLNRLSIKLTHWPSKGTSLSRNTLWHMDRQNWSIDCWDITIFHFFLSRWRPSVILNSWSTLWTTRKVYLDVFISVQNLVGIAVIYTQMRHGIVT